MLSTLLRCCLFWMHFISLYSHDVEMASLPKTSSPSTDTKKQQQQQQQEGSRRVLLKPLDEPCLLIKRGSHNHLHGSNHECWECEINGIQILDIVTLDKEKVQEEEEANLLFNNRRSTGNNFDEYLTNHHDEIMSSSLCTERFSSKVNKNNTAIESGITTLYSENAYIYDNKKLIILTEDRTITFNNDDDDDNGTFNDEVLSSSHNRKEHRRTQSVTGIRSVLALRVIGPDAQTSRTEEYVADKVFGTDGDMYNLRTQMEQCSYEQLIFYPSASSPLIKNGVYTVTIDETVTGKDHSDVRNAALEKLIDDFGGVSRHDIADHIMVCLPPGTTPEWIGYGFTNHWLSVYNDDWCTFLTAQMHEVGHNLGLQHSGRGEHKYADTSGNMGHSYAQDEGPRMCYNAAKSWQLGWYEDRARYAYPLEESYWFNLIGVANYKSSDIADDDTIVIKLSGGEPYDYFINFNRKVGINQGVVTGGDKVMIVQHDNTLDKYTDSYEVAQLDEGDDYVISNFGDGHDITIKVIRISKLDDLSWYATIEINGPIPLPAKERPIQTIDWISGFQSEDLQ